MFASDLLKRGPKVGETIEITNGWVEIREHGDIEFIIAETNQVAFTITSIIRYLNDEQVYSLVRSGEAALKIANLKDEPTHINWSSSELQKVYVMFYRQSEDTVKKILEDDSISLSKKFAAIISVLSVCPSLPFSEAKEIVLAQIDPDDVEILTFERLKMFLYPNFADTVDTKDSVWVATEWGINGKELRTLIRYTGFLAYSEKDEMYSEYLKRNKGNYFRPIFNNKVMGNVQNRVKALSEFGLESKIKEFTAPQAMRFVNLYMGESSVFSKFFEDRLNHGAPMAIEESNWSPEGLSYLSVIPLAKILTREEILKLDSEIKDDPNSPFISAWLPNSSMWLTAYYYVTGGYSAVRELFDVVSSESKYEKFFMKDIFGMSGQDRNMHPRHLSMFMRATDTKYKDMPLEWRINIL